MTSARVLSTTVASLIIAVAVVLSGMHAKDFATASLPALWLDAKKQADDASHGAKVSVELHSHVDKVVKVQSNGDQSNQTDGRSLRLLHDKKDVFKNKLADRLRIWWQLNTLYLG